MESSPPGASRGVATGTAAAMLPMLSTRTSQEAVVQCMHNVDNSMHASDVEAAVQPKMDSRSSLMADVLADASPGSGAGPLLGVPRSASPPPGASPVAPHASHMLRSASPPLASRTQHAASTSSTTVAVAAPSPTCGSPSLRSPSTPALTVPPETPFAQMSEGMATPLRRSNRHPISGDGSSTTDEHSMAKAMRRQAARNLDPTPGTSVNKSFLSFSDTRISSSLMNIGVGMGNNLDDVRVSVGALKRMEIDRLKVSPKCLSTPPNPDTEEEDETDATYVGPLMSHLVGEVTEVGLDDARLGFMFCDFTASLRKSKSHSSRKKQKPPKKAKISTPTRVST
jgi:hypothetical protein